MTPELLKSEADNCDAQSGLSPAPLLGCSPTLCACGCGQPVAPDDRGRARAYVRNNWNVGRKQSPEWVAKKVAGMKRAWADPSKLQTMRHQSPELVEKRAAKMRGRKFTAEQCARVSAGLTGRKLSEEHKLKSSKGWIHGFPSLTDEAKEKCRHSMSMARIGCHNFGRAARDRLDHFNARHWVVRDPVGRIFEFDNAQSWARKNESLFLPDEYPDSKLPLWFRFISGLNGMQRKDRKGQHSWKGWVLVSVTECETTGAPDLLARDKQPNVESLATADLRR